MEILSESRMSFGRLAKELGISTPTVWRWSRSGVRGVVLESFVSGGRRFTSREAYERFVIRTTAAANGQLVPSRTNRQRRASISRARRELAAAGV